MINILSLMTADVLVDAIEKEQGRVGHSLSNEELQDLVHKLIQEGKAQLLAAQKDVIDIDLLAGNLREDGYRVLNINEKPPENATA